MSNQNTAMLEGVAEARRHTPRTDSLYRSVSTHTHVTLALLDAMREVERDLEETRYRLGLLQPAPVEGGDDATPR